MSGEYQHRTYRMARAYIQEPDGTVREATPAELTDLGARVAKAMAKAMLRSVQSSKFAVTARVIEKARGYIARRSRAHSRKIWREQSLRDESLKGDDLAGS